MKAKWHVLSVAAASLFLMNFTQLLASPFNSASSSPISCPPLSHTQPVLYSLLTLSVCLSTHLAHMDPTLCSPCSCRTCHLLCLFGASVFVSECVSLFRLRSCWAAMRLPLCVELLTKHLLAPGAVLVTGHGGESKTVMLSKGGHPGVLLPCSLGVMVQPGAGAGAVPQIPSTLVRWPPCWTPCRGSSSFWEWERNSLCPWKPAACPTHAKLPSWELFPLSLSLGPDMRYFQVSLVMECSESVHAGPFLSCFHRLGVCHLFFIF